jgi:hypothetical protein
VGADGSADTRLVTGCYVEGDLRARETRTEARQIAQRLAQGEALIFNLGRDQILWTIRTAVGMPDRAMDLPYLRFILVASPASGNRCASDFAVGRSRNPA